MEPQWELEWSGSSMHVIRSRGVVVVATMGVGMEMGGPTDGAQEHCHQIM